MLESVGDYKSHYIYPRHDVEKTEEWHLNWAKYIYGQHQRGNNGILSPEKILLYRSYAEGKQDVEQYKSILLNNQNDTQTVPSAIDDNSNTKRVFNEGWLSVDFTKILSPMPKFVKNIIGKFESNEHEIIVNAIDKFSGFEKENEKAKLWFESKFGKDLEPIDKMNGLELEKPEYIPESEQELEMFDMAGGFKLRYEIAMEKIMNHAVYVKSNLKDIKRRCLKDAIVLNQIALMDDVDKETQQCYLKYINPDDVVIQYCKDGQYHKAAWAGVQEYYSIVDIRMETGWDEDKINKLAKTINGKFGNNMLRSDDDYNIQVGGYYKYDDFTVPVFHFFVKSFDRNYKIKTKRKNGTEKKDIRTNSYGKLGKDEKLDGYEDIRTVYEGKWIIGTEDLICFGKMSDIPFNYKTRDVQLPIHVSDIVGTPIMETAIPILDQINLIHLKMQNLRAVAPPPGWNIEIGALEDLSFDNHDWSPLELIRLKTQSGTTLYKAMVNSGTLPNQNYTSGKPITWESGGMGNAIYEFVYDLEKNFQLLAENMGIDRVSALMKTPAEQAVGVTQIGVDATSNTLQVLYDGWIDVKERAANNIACRVPNMIYFNKNDEIGYYDIIGRSDIETMKQAIGRHPIQFGCYIYAKLTEQERNEIKQAGLVAMQAGKNGVPGISMADFMLIENIMNRPGGINFARMFLAYKEKKKEEEAAKRSQETIMLQSKASSEQEQAKKQLEAQINKEKVLGEIAVIKAKGEEDRKTKAFEYYLETGKSVDVNSQGQPEMAGGQQNGQTTNPEQMGELMQQAEQGGGEMPEMESNIEEEEGGNSGAMSGELSARREYKKSEVETPEVMTE